MDSNERVIQALHEFENMTDADKVLTQELEELFIQIAHTGRIQIPWIYLKPVFMFKLDKVMRDFFESSPSRNSTSSEPTHTAEFDVMRQRLLDCIESFTGAPFTVQRLCELMIEPKRHYRSSEKFMRGVEKNILVVSTMSDMEGQGLTNSHENDTIPNGPVTNGIITTGSATEMSSVSDKCCDINGQQPEHYHDTHYPTSSDLLHINGNDTLEKTNGDSLDTIQAEETEDKTNEIPAEESGDAESKTSSAESEEKTTDDSDNNESSDSSDSFSEEKCEEQQSTETSEQEEKNTEDKEKSIEEKENNEDEETVKEDSKKHKEVLEDTKCEEKIESKHDQEEKEEETSLEEPMEE